MTTEGDVVGIHFSMESGSRPYAGGKWDYQKLRISLSFSIWSASSFHIEVDPDYIYLFVVICLLVFDVCRRFDFHKYGEHDQESKYYGKDGRMKNITFLHIFFGLLVLGLLQLYALNV